LNTPPPVKQVWHDPVWSNVIGTLISTSAIGGIAWSGEHFGVWFATWPVPGWLLGILGLVIIVCLIRMVRLERRVKRLSSDKHQQFWQWIGRIRDYADFAEVLNARLEAVWHQWNDSGEKLIYPLSKTAIPDIDKPLSWSQRQLLEFRILYKNYLVEVHAAYPEFHSRLIDEGFPCDFPDQTYLLVRNKITTHGASLHESAIDQIDSFLKQSD
jgi:hypothetical protein